jgi:hypothetical protein
MKPTTTNSFEKKGDCGQVWVMAMQEKMEE